VGAGERFRQGYRNGIAGDARFARFPVSYRARPRQRRPGSIHRLNDYELASRLSFFLWSSIPDDELLKAAEQGRLKDQKVLDQQVARMLDDPKSKAFVSNFSGQWCSCESGSGQARPDVFPDFDNSLRKAFQQETELFFRAVMRDNRPVTEFLDAKYTYLNQRLAEFYGIEECTAAVPESGTSGRAARRLAFAGEHPDGHVVPESNVGGAARQMGASRICWGHRRRRRRRTCRPSIRTARTGSFRCARRWNSTGPTRSARRAIRRWTRSGSLLRTSTASERGATKIKITGRHRFVWCAAGRIEFDGAAGLRQALLSAHRDEFVATLTES